MKQESKIDGEENTNQVVEGTEESSELEMSLYEDNEWVFSQ